jgi:hypothetical protein
MRGQLVESPALTLEDLFAVRRSLPLISDRELADLGPAITRRHMDEIHQCVFCGEQARAAVAAGASDLLGPARWLDLCPAHNQALRIMLDELGRLAFNTEELDAEIIHRYEQWLTFSG